MLKKSEKSAQINLSLTNNSTIEIDDDLAQNDM